MKVIQQTSSELTLQTQPWVLWIMGGVFAIAGLVIPLLASQTTLACQRLEANQGNCNLHKFSSLSTTTQTIALKDLRGARVDSYRDSDGDRTYRVMLQLPDRERMFLSFSSYGAATTLSDRINHFVQNPSIPTLQEGRDDRSGALMFAPIFIVIGLGIAVFLGQRVTCHFDRRSGYVRITKQGVLGSQTADYSLREVVDVQVEASRSSSSNGETFRVSLVLANGDRLPLTSYYSSGWNDKKETADQIKTFLQLRG
uniref:Transmembrane protein n=1 Tax=Cyanothece sp. (strain PCC 7425 / ATCC 29141) TaxID=395961 RepID=B8HVH2_CYAP4